MIAFVNTVNFQLALSKLSYTEIYERTNERKNERSSRYSSVLRRVPHSHSKFRISLLDHLRPCHIILRLDFYANFPTFLPSWKLSQSFCIRTYLRYCQLPVTSPKRTLAYLLISFTLCAISFVNYSRVTNRKTKTR